MDVTVICHFIYSIYGIYLFFLKLYNNFFKKVIIIQNIDGFKKKKKKDNGRDEIGNGNEDGWVQNGVKNVEQEARAKEGVGGQSWLLGYIHVTKHSP